jgi:hypothetical protein
MLVKFDELKVLQVAEKVADDLFSKEDLDSLSQTTKSTNQPIN